MILKYLSLIVFIAKDLRFQYFLVFFTSSDHIYFQPDQEAWKKDHLAKNCATKLNTEMYSCKKMRLFPAVLVPSFLYREAIHYDNFF
jgi:hypothetical protein